jgi:nitrite reductase/ring-hydroxylating ferredoxin subunit
MKYFEQTLVTFIWNTCNICNISIYFCNIRMKALGTYLWNIWNTWNIRLQHALSAQRNISLLRRRMEARRCVKFIGGSVLATLVGGGPAAVAARCGKEAASLTIEKGSHIHQGATHVGPTALVCPWRGPSAPLRRHVEGRLGFCVVARSCWGHARGRCVATLDACPHHNKRDGGNSAGGTWERKRRQGHTRETSGGQWRSQKLSIGGLVEEFQP